MPHGGICAALGVVQDLGLVDRINERLQVLRRHRPYHESDHVLNIAFNAMCGGRTLDDIELRRNDEAYLDALGAVAIPDPTTAGDFCRRFEAPDVEALLEAINDSRLEVWSRQDPAFLSNTARIDADGTMDSTTGECKEGMSISHDGIWGYHPLLVSLANTGEPLYIVNRPGNRPSHEGAPSCFDKAIALCRKAGFSDVLIRGDTDFALTKHFDRWTSDGVRFIFGNDASPNLVNAAYNMSSDEFQELTRRAKKTFEGETNRRATQPRVKKTIVRERGYKKLRLRSEDIAEFDYSPARCAGSYRVVVVRKNLTVERGKIELFEDVRHLFYITNDHDLPAERVVFEANDRCNQENLIDQLKNGTRALYAPVNSLNANWAYMVMTSLAWTLKAWMALSLPVSFRWREKHEAERTHWLRMEFRTFVNAVINIPAQVVRSSRRTIIRFLAWRPQQHTLFRLLDTW